jgi:nucleotide-binding universal stress UspA family protein
MKILCPTDFSEPARAAVRAAIKLVYASGGELELFHAYQYPPAYMGFPPPGFTRELDQEVDAELDKLRSSLDAPGVKIAVAKALGVPWDEIVRRAREGGFDLIAMSTHGRTGIARALIGSVAEKVVRHAECAVMVVRHQAPGTPHAVRRGGGNS